MGEDHLRQIFSINNSLLIQKVKKIRNFAFIHYYSRKDAENALNNLSSINGIGFDIDVTWAKPPYMQRNVRYLKGRKGDTSIKQQYQLTSIGKFVRSTLSPNDPIQILENICHLKRVGEPLYKISYSTSNISDSCLNYTSQVFLPNRPYPLNDSLPPGKGFSSPQDAKMYAALCALKNIGYQHNIYNKVIPPPPAVHLQYSSPPPISTVTPVPVSNALPECNMYTIAEEEENGEFPKPFGTDFVASSQNSGPCTLAEQCAQFIPPSASGAPNHLDLMATAAAVANFELQTSSLDV